MIKKIFIFWIIILLFSNYHQDKKIRYAQDFFHKQNFTLIEDLEYEPKDGRPVYTQIVYGNYLILKNSSISKSLELLSSPNPHTRAYGYLILLEKLCNDNKKIEKYVFPSFKDSTLIWGVFGGHHNRGQLNVHLFLHIFDETQKRRCYPLSKIDSISTLYKVLH